MPPDGPDKHSKTERPTSHKLRKTREQGQVAMSRDLSSTLGLVFGMIMAAVMGPTIAAGFKQFFLLVAQDFNFDLVAPEGINFLMADIFQRFILLAGPIVGVVWLAGFAAATAQAGFHVSFKPLEPKFEKINPIEGFKRLVSKRGLVNLTISILKMLLIAAVTSSVLLNENNTLVLMNLTNIKFILAKSGAMIWEIAFKASITLIIIALIDFSYQKWQFLEDQKMTKQELKDENKEHEGDPQIKSKIKSIQRATAQKRGLKETVAEADVVVTNPFHIAVAIKYDKETGDAPIVVAKGARLLAERIKTFARDAEVEIIQNIPVARALYKEVKVGWEIPPTLYVAVAEILAIVFRRKQNVMS
ncbi:MAG: EscU/YscU/HrcU family type III secretion system export apparatus switch protein [Candidatus Melainabacteria bacterium]|nr:EscU/YscU/HrcU family type III secretion system export apparatus switch protein [Candidatus Melainabacteria bacterium]